ncbi:MAG TPA: hypothetical protein VG755_21995 [Nannocystaceae bacterium]|nr:hypothetical protein [Nannocystaceae bacterium]
MLLPFAALVLAIPEPCYGLAGPSEIEGEHVWVEYPAGVSMTQAMAVTVAADTAWSIYADDLGWTEPPQPIAVRADLTNDMAAGQCVTMECEGVDVPLCHVYGPAFQGGYAAQTTAHEIGHAFQYALMGSYLDSLTSWAWWMEGTATWIEHFYEPDPRVWNRVDDYVANPQWTLMNDFADLFAGERGDHMYGTAVLAFFLEQYYGGPDTVRQTWEWGASHSGEKILFRDAIEGIGLSFAEVWPHYLARITVLDLEGGENVATIPTHTVINALPGAGAPPEASRPEGLGFGVVHIPAELGMPNVDLRVQVDGDPTVPWHAVIARTDGTVPGSAVIDYVVATWDDAGHGELLLPGFDGTADAFLALSPESIEHTPFDYSISAELVPAGADGSSSTTADPTTTTSTDTTTSDDEGSSESTAREQDDSSGCGCRSTGSPAWGAALLLFAVCYPRRRWSPIPS